MTGEGRGLTEYAGGPRRNVAGVGLGGGDVVALSFYCLFQALGSSMMHGERGGREGGGGGGGR